MPLRPPRTGLRISVQHSSKMEQRWLRLILHSETVSTEIDYHVFLTPRGECKGLYVINQKGTPSRCGS